MTERIVFWLDDYSDEITPCDCSLEGWATWLSQPDEGWGRDAAAKDGERFKATRAVVTYHTACRCDDGGWRYEPPLPEGYSFVAPSYGDGMGWDADEMVEDVKDLPEGLDFDEGSIVAAIVEDHVGWIVAYRADPPRCEAEKTH